ncbi:MAG: bacteriophage abortive infection AbiH family protein [Deltaproteobacteria bacterium]|jgi:hypothetical protein|nr:bacteriophage abortive infection AbiH family protein [Deltaproteobacteria bacterium]
MNIIILGNGFDLAHGLETKYSNFLDYCKYYQPENNISEYNKINDEFNNITTNNLWIKIFNAIKSDSDNWIDLEIQIYKVLVLFSYYCSINELSVDIIKSVNFLHNQLHEILIQTIKDSKWDFIHFHDGKYNDKFIINDINKMSSILYNELRTFIKCFELYCFFVINKQIDNIAKGNNYKLNLPIFNVINKNHSNSTYIINFNYTSTFNSLYHNQLFSEVRHDIKYSFIHGKINDNLPIDFNKKVINSNQIILGTQNFDRKSIDKNFPMAINQFQKYNQRHKYRTVDEYQKLLSSLKMSNKNDHRIHVVGHSLEKSDHGILKNIFKANNYSKIIIYYYNENSHQKYLDNITEILGEEDVDMRVIFTDLKDKQYGFLIPNDIKHI